MNPGALYLANERGRLAEAEQPQVVQGHQLPSEQPLPASAPLYEVAHFNGGALAYLARLCGCGVDDFETRYA